MIKGKVVIVKTEQPETSWGSAMATSGGGGTTHKGTERNGGVKRTGLAVGLCDWRRQQKR